MTVAPSTTDIYTLAGRNAEEVWHPRFRAATRRGGSRLKAFPVNQRWKVSLAWSRIRIIPKLVSFSALMSWSTTSIAIGVGHTNAEPQRTDGTGPR